MEKDFLKSKLHERNKRITPQREAVYNALINNINHPSAEEIYKEIINKYPNLSLATVYQILNMFENELGIVKSIIVENIKHYEINSQFHIHLICPECNQIKDIYSDKIKSFWENLTDELQIKPKDQTIKIYQICAVCSKKLNIIDRI
ncbi:MAG: transcriptional repressor [Promethearchaeota archaeon]|nr:MAG: transcriptional repressor [Candidatus Lokiarchaeota archaeon]